MATLRGYLTQDEYESITGINTTLIDSQISEAESIIDNACADFLGSLLQKSIVETEVFENITTTTTTATLKHNHNKNYWKFATVQILNGNKEGYQSRVLSSDGNTITFNEITSLSGATAIKLYQLGKFPMLKDTEHINSTIYKFIPEEIKVATAWQILYLIENPSLLHSPVLQSESIGTSYSYSLGNIQDRQSIYNILSPRVIQLIKPYMIQTI